MDKRCCEAMARVLAEWDGPFYEPVTIEAGKLGGGRLAVVLYKVMPGRNGIPNKPRSALFLNYCPFCGQDLRGE